jgi:predicted Zn-dependent peptidase
MPANQLEAALFLESDRMRALAISTENLDNQRSAVQEERRLRVDNQAYGHADEAMDDLAFDNPAYKHSVIGSMADLNAASVADVAAFFKTYYAPNNAVLVIAGDVDTARTLARVRSFFASIPSQPPPPPVDLAQPAQTKERRLDIDDPLARLPRIDIGYRIPSSLSPDDDAIDVLSEVLSGGRSARFYKSIVRDQQLAVSVQAFADTSRGPRLFGIEARPTAQAPLDQLEQAVYREIEGLKSGVIADDEIDRARTSARRRFTQSLGTSLSRARLLAEYTLFYGEPARINTRWDRLSAYNADAVQRLARTYLRPENRTVIVTHPTSAPAGRGGAQ